MAARLRKDDKSRSALVNTDIKIGLEMASETGEITNDLKKFERLISEIVQGV